MATGYSPGAEAFVYHAAVTDGDDTSAEPHPTPETGSAVDQGPLPPAPIVRRIPPWVLVLALWLVAGAVFPTPALVDAATGLAPMGVRFERSIGYMVFAPLFGALDLLTLLTPAQHFALLTTVVGLFVGVRTAAARKGRSRGAGWRAWAVLLLGAGGFYVMSASVPRPTARAVSTDPNVVRVDFHSHTRHSPDVGDGYTVEWNRAWHARAGFDAAFITDHQTWEGVREATSAGQDGRGVALLAGVETRLDDQPVIGLGDSTLYTDGLDREGSSIDPDVRPTLLFILPADLDAITRLEADPVQGLVGIEVVNGTPTGLHQSRTERGPILDIAERMDLALVSGTDNHGWGQSAAAWSLVNLPGWRDLGPGELGRAIARKLHEDRRDAVVVVERTVPGARGQWLQVLTVPVLAVHVTRSLSTGERAVWLIWVTLGWLVAALKGRTSAREPSGEAAGRV